MRVVMPFLIVFCLLAIPVLADDADQAVTQADVDPGLEERISSLEKSVDEFLGKFGLEFYGHFKLDMAYDQAETNDGNTAMWVKPYHNGDQDNEFNMTARHTRFGFNYVAPESWGPRVTAKLELDFYGGNAENKANVRLRHAFFNMDFGDGWSVLAGQTWDVMQPLWQWKLNTAVGWNQGNTAFRRAQLRGTKAGKLGEETTYKVAFAIADPIAIDADKDAQDDGEDAGGPDLQGRIGLGFPLFADAPPMNFGVGAMYGWRESDFDDGDEDWNAWMLGADLTLPITKDIKILAEAFTGQSLSLYAGGIGQSYNSTDMDEIKTEGGFLNLHWKLGKLWFLVVGAGIDDPKNKDLKDKDRSRNTTTFANIRYKITKQVWVGLEVDRMVTEYKNAPTSRNMRIQMTWILKF
jgi:hypothetical protein